MCETLFYSPLSLSKYWEVNLLYNLGVKVIECWIKAIFFLSWKKHCFLVQIFTENITIGLLLLHTATAATAKSLQSCPTLCDPRDGSPPGSPVPGILQARTLEWVAISFSNAWKWKVKVKSLSLVWLLVIPWTAAYQAPPSMGFSGQQSWSGVPSPSPKYTP